MASAFITVDLRNMEPVKGFIRRVEDVRSLSVESAIRLGPSPEGRAWSRIADALEAALLDLQFESE
jgi:hypothetical protein